MLRRPLKIVLVLLLATLSVTSCSGPVAIYEKVGLPGGDALVTSAEVRTVFQTKLGSGSSTGRVTPTYITCAEPSPDVAKIVSTAVGAGGALSIQGLPSGVSPQAAAAFSRASAQAMAQLTERLATIQLLRDGLHRACEAYANGAITDTTYAVMLSRFDKLMVTLLLGEIAGGAFGRSLAVLGSETDSEGSSKLDTTENRPAATAAVPTTAGGGSGTSAQGGDPAVRELSAKLEAATKAMAKATATASGDISVRQVPEVAKTLHDMQRKYVENINFDALEVACVSALDRDQLSPGQLKDVLAFAGLHQQYQAQLKHYQTQLKQNPQQTPPTPPAQLLEAADRVLGSRTETRQTALASYCMTSIIPTIQLQKGELLRDILERAGKERAAAGQRADVLKELDQAKQYLERVKALTDVLTPR